MLALCTAAEDRYAVPRPVENHENAIDKRNTEHKERRCDFATRVDGEHAEHQSEEHCTRITDDDAREWELKKESRASDCRKHKREHGQLRLLHSLTEREKTDRQETDERNGVHLPRND